MMVARAVYHRVINAERAANGHTTLTEDLRARKWLVGSLVMPGNERGSREFTYTDWAEIAPYNDFTGPGDHSAG